ncbi:MAG: PSD1 and planctomycete cytochrome C domain-containing protein [Verrucomicrobiota bacterium]|nr:PSD1 and planctomycete cytochrome C domain-containing protein [Verrucomicrobiota bacterium]
MQLTALHKRSCYRMDWILRTLALALACLNTSEDSTAQTLQWSEPIASLFQTHCTRCHGSDQQKGDLRLDSVQGLIQGGNSGEPLISPGEASQTYLMQRLTTLHEEDRMPPDQPGPDQGELNLLLDWIDEHQSQIQQAMETSIPIFDHWSFQPLSRPPLPDLQDGQSAHPVDRFILERLRGEGLEASPRADKETLARRLSLITLGIPAPLDWLDLFLADPRADAYERLVDRFLASPQFGETWARHWLDVARYADSNGFETNRERKNAWPYRDYVIDAFNQDKPYAQFVSEQLAGDVLGANPATGFLVAGPFDIVKSPDITLTLTQRQNELDDMIHTTSSAFLGLTMGCARCHNHKFDPIQQREYYAMQAIFAGVQHGDRPLRTTLRPERKKALENLEVRYSRIEAEIEHWRELAEQRQQVSQKPLRKPVTSTYNEEEWPPTQATALRFTILSSSSAEPCIDEWEVFNVEGTNVALKEHGTTVEASGTLKGYAIHQLDHIHDGHYGNQRSWISSTAGSGWILYHFQEPVILEKTAWSRDRENLFRDRVVTEYLFEIRQADGTWKTVADSTDRAPFATQEDTKAFLAHLNPEERSKVTSLIRQRDSLASDKEQLSALPTAWLGTFTQPKPTHRLYRGDPLEEREAIRPASPRIFNPFTLEENALEKDRRLQLARWITDPKHPLTARVMVNRLWHYVFGRGLVGTPSDFGKNGLRPSHPDLLDWLADEFLQSNGSIKSLLRILLTSETFKQQSQPRESGLRMDATGELLWRFRPRRLSAEAIRDSILHCSGNLKNAMGGPGFYLLDVQAENVMHYFPKANPGKDTFRRMVYMNRIRQEQDAIFGAFDCPDGNQVMPDRPESTTPIQALNLFNSPFIMGQARALAERLKDASQPNSRHAIELGFRWTQGRAPDAEEMALSLELVEAEGLEAFCRALFNANRFLFVL